MSTNNYSHMNDYELNSLYLHTTEENKREIEGYVYKKLLSKIRGCVFFTCSFSQRDDRLQEAYFVLIKCLHNFKPHLVEDKNRYSIWIRYKRYLKSNSIDMYRNNTARNKAEDIYIISQAVKGRDYIKDHDYKDNDFIEKALNESIIEDYISKSTVKDQYMMIFKEYLKGKSYVTIANQLGFSRERIRQVMNYMKRDIIHKVGFV